MRILHSEYAAWLLLWLSFQVEIIIATSCNRRNITHSRQNDAITVQFSANHLLKSDRKVRCTPNNLPETVNGCAHRCADLGYGQFVNISVELSYTNGTTDTCTIDYHTELQAPTLTFFDVPGDRIRFGVRRPNGSFDSVKVHCSDEDSYTIFNASTPVDRLEVTTECWFTPNLPSKNILLETLKEDFSSAITEINEEVPLPVPFNSSLDSLSLTVQAGAPPAMNLNSTYELQVRFFDKNNESITYERAKVVQLGPRLGAVFHYGLIPNLKHQITFTHIVNSTFYATSTSTVTPTSTGSYPYQVTNLRVQEEFHNIIVSWNDSHAAHDPVEFFVSCNSNNNLLRNVGRNTTYVCENVLFNQTDRISVETRIAIPDYTHDHTPTASIDVQQVPLIPISEISGQGETNITIRWTSDDHLPVLKTFQYRIQCGLNSTSVPIEIERNEYQCQSLEPGTLYVITMQVVNIDNTTQRARSIQASTLLQKCQYRSHVYFRDHDGSRSVLIEWRPPEKNFEKIFVHCPSTYTQFEYTQTMSLMYSKCTVADGSLFNVTFSTFKSGYDLATFQFTDTPPNDDSTTVLTSLTTTSTVTPVSRDSTTTTTLVTANSSTSLNSACNEDDLFKARVSLTRWRIAAIIALILGGFLALSTILLIVFSVILCLRSGYDIHDQH